MRLLKFKVNGLKQSIIYDTYTYIGGLERASGWICVYRYSLRRSEWINNKLRLPCMSRRAASKASETCGRSVAISYGPRTQSRGYGLNERRARWIYVPLRFAARMQPQKEGEDALCPWSISKKRRASETGFSEPGSPTLPNDHLRLNHYRAIDAITITFELNHSAHLIIIFATC